MDNSFAEFRQLLSHPVRSRWFLLSRLPSAFFSGVRLRSLDESDCMVSVPYTWFTRNPFRSTYFACLSMAAEMSTGALAMAWLYRRRPAVSMLVVKMEAAYFKKATGLTRFFCRDGQAIRSAIEETARTGEAVLVTARSAGFNASNDLVAEFLVTWSFKRKTKN